MSVMSLSYRLPVVVAALGMALAVASTGRAQTDALPPTEVTDALTRILAVPGSPTPINRFIGAGRQPAAVVARRARGLIQTLRSQRDKIDPTAYLGAVGQISAAAARALASTAIVGLAVASNYRPENVVIAFDFGPADGAVMPGFERVERGDPRIKGDILALRRPDTNPLLSDGLAGIEKIAVSVAPGDYRIILITQNLGDPKVSRLPFGREVRVNGVPFRIERSDFVHWRYEALLAGGDTRLPGAGGYRTGTLPADGGPLFALQQGGAVILEAKTSSDRLTIELSGFAGARSYLTGLVIERLDRISNVALSPPGRRGIVPLRQRLELEAEVLAEAAGAIEGIEPALGQTPQNDIVVSQDN